MVFLLYTSNAVSTTTGEVQYDRQHVSGRYLIDRLSNRERPVIQSYYAMGSSEQAKLDRFPMPPACVLCLMALMLSASSTGQPV